MKGYNIHTFVLSVVTFVVTSMMFVSCEGVVMHDDGCKALLDSAAISMGNMDYAKAKQQLSKVLDHGNNKMHRASADLLMMRISVLLAEYKEFYDYRSDCEECMAVLKDAESYMTPRQTTIWHYMQSSFYRVSARYYHIMRENDSMLEMLDTLSNHPEWLDADSLRFDLTLQPQMLLRAEYLFTVADRLSEDGDFQGALDTLAVTMHLINRHHLINNKGVAPDDTLTLTGMITDSISKEMQWISDPNVVAIPEWMIHVREHLSMVYAALGDKESSNYNRNLYYDILDVVRQDVKMQRTKELLESESQKLNYMIVMIIALFAVLIMLAHLFAVRTKRTSAIKHDRLKKCLDICNKIVNGDDVEGEVTLLLPEVEGDWRNAEQSSIKSSFERELLSLMQVMDKWMKQNSEMYLSLSERKEELEGEIYMAQRRMDDNKRQHVERATAISIVQGITPFLDRAIHHVENYTDVDSSLLREYIEKINAYNEVLGHWVKVRQGSVILNVENFALAPILETLKKGHRSFDSKKIELNIAESDAVVKADKALTLFMMNTLLDNARKYTPQGGKVTLAVENTEGYVEVSVSDTGHGLSAEDQDKINNTKVYDSSQIGVENDADGQVRQNKGFGFGLMNCRGIIEKYRKSGKIFDVCQFGVESTLGKGSRFFFRLPKGVMRSLCLLILFSLNIISRAYTAQDYIDSVYSANIQGDYSGAVTYAGFAINELNKEYVRMTGRAEPLLKLYDNVQEYAELEWFKDSVDVDYALIIQLRNEVSLAALSLVDRGLYRYNNEVFLRLNRLVSHDPDTEKVCRQLQNANANKLLIMNLTVLVLLISLVTYMLVYYHHNILPVFNMRQLLEFNRRIFSKQESQLPQLLYEGINSVHPVDAVEVKLMNGDRYSYKEGECRSEIPLRVDFEGENHELGSLNVAYHGSKPTRNEALIIDFIAQFVSIHTFFESVKVDEQNNILELLEEQRFAADVEQQRLHVQNMVLDNCLSTIKHETMYYPNRILQLLDSGDNAGVHDIQDVLKYYREVFGLLSENANRQLSRSIVKLQSIKLKDLAKYAQKSFEKKNKKLMLPLKFEVTGDLEGNVRADIILLQYLLDTLISPLFEGKTEGKVELNFEKSSGFVKFALSDSRVNRTEEECALLFYADSMRYDKENDMLNGAEYLIAKQIIREHDERLHHQGCRIYAEANRVVFTLPQA